MLDEAACAIEETALPFRTDDGIGSTANLGLIACETDQTVEAEFRAAAERAIGKPVTSSNHVLAWHVLRLAGVASGAGDPGRLFAA